MSYENWKDKTNEFQVVDVRGISGNFFPRIKEAGGAAPCSRGTAYHSKL